MKKNKKIRILDIKANADNYTFLNDDNILSQSSSTSSFSKDESNAEGHPIPSEKREEKYIKKKAINKSQSNIASKALKFSNQSQRNHSSVYE
jgi:hypothetical protein